MTLLLPWRAQIHAGWEGEHGSPLLWKCAPWPLFTACSTGLSLDHSSLLHVQHPFPLFLPPSRRAISEKIQKGNSIAAVRTRWAEGLKVEIRRHTSYVFNYPKHFFWNRRTLFAFFLLCLNLGWTVSSLLKPWVQTHLDWFLSKAGWVWLRTSGSAALVGALLLMGRNLRQVLWLQWEGTEGRVEPFSGAEEALCSWVAILPFLLSYTSCEITVIQIYEPKGSCPPIPPSTSSRGWQWWMEGRQSPLRCWHQPAPRWHHCRLLVVGFILCGIFFVRLKLRPLCIYVTGRPFQLRN
jgi:hypothetical protein